MTMRLKIMFLLAAFGLILCLCGCAFAEEVPTYDCDCTDIHWHVLPLNANNLGCYEPVCGQEHEHDYKYYTCFDRDNPICGKESKLHELDCLTDHWVDYLRNYNYSSTLTDKMNIPAVKKMPYIYASMSTYQASNHRVQDVVSKELSNLQLMVLANVEGYASGDTWRTLPENSRYTPGAQHNWVPAYCADKQYDAKQYKMYKQINTEDSTYFDAATAEKIRAVMLNSYPYYTMEEMQARLANAGFEDAALFDESVMIAATQLAIWNFANEYDAPEEHPEPYKTRWIYNHTEDKQRYAISAHAPAYDKKKDLTVYYMPQAKDRIARMTEYLVNTAKANPQPAGEDQIVVTRANVTDLAVIPNVDPDTLQATLWVSFNTPLRAHDGAVLNVTATSASGATATAQMTSGQGCEIVLNGYQLGETIDVTVDGYQYVSRGVYFYEPDAGEGDVRSYSQNLVGINAGLTPVVCSVHLEPAALTLQKVNHLGDVLTDAAFTLSYVRPETNGEKILIGTYQVDEQGQIQLTNLIAGATYELQEVQTPAGYATLKKPVRFQVLSGETAQIKLEQNDQATLQDGVLTITNHLPTPTPRPTPVPTPTPTATPEPTQLPLPPTGDHAAPISWVLLMAVSLLGLMMILRQKKLHA